MDSSSPEWSFLEGLAEDDPVVALLFQSCDDGDISLDTLKIQNNPQNHQPVLTSTASLDSRAWPEKPENMMKTGKDYSHCNYSSWKSCSLSSSSSKIKGQQVISFGTTLELDNASKKPYKDGLYAQEHVLSERRRRQKLSQRFLALTTLIPGLTKMDKASILEDAIKYIRKLEEQVKLFEERTTNKTSEPVDQASLEPKPKHAMDDVKSCLNQENSSADHPLFTIQARAMHGKVLINIYAQNNRDLMANILRQIADLHLTTLNSCGMLFGTNTIDITVIAQMDVEIRMTMEDLVQHLWRALQQFYAGN